MVCDDDVYHESRWSGRLIEKLYNYTPLIRGDQEIPNEAIWKRVKLMEMGRGTVGMAGVISGRRPIAEHGAPVNRSR